MTTNHPKTGVEPASEMLYVWNVPQAAGSAHHNIGMMNQPLPQSFRESFKLSALVW